MDLRWLLPCLLVLAGCQATPSALPSAEPAPAAECRWRAGEASPAEVVRTAVAVLEAEGFVIRHTDLTLGLVSADRSERIPGYRNPYDDWAEPTWYGAFGVGRRGGFSSGVAVGFGGGLSAMNRDATRLERVSLVADDAWVRVSRDLQVIDWRGQSRESRSASDAEFCRTLRHDLAGETT